MNQTDLDEFVLANMPHFIAVNYQRLLAAQTPRERVEQALHTYNLGLRALTIGLVSQYLVRDRDSVSDPYLNELLLQKFPHLTLDAWKQILFASLRAYEGKRELFFMPELYDFYWDTSTLPHRWRAEVEQPFERLTQIALEIQTGRLLPEDEAEWERLAEETRDLLAQILGSMAFIGQYDLIRVLDYDGQCYDFELHKGLKASRGRQPLPTHIELNRGWFYLREGAEDFLLLHPLLVFWEGEAGRSELVPTDTGVYDRFVYERLQYLLATLGRTIVDEKSVRAFVTLLCDTIEEAKRQRQEAERLTWWQLRDICADITRQRMATVRGKYRGDLYLQRDKTRQAFERFLASDKRCFVLIGKSGVGKSNFLLALGEEVHQSRSDVCVLMYDGAHLKVEPSATEVISQDFDDRLILDGQRVQNVWREIAQVDRIGDRLVVLCVDAINENRQAKELLRQLDELVQKPWPWLRVVFSSRPETWQSIKRGVRLAEALYYREEETEMVGVELEPFSYSERMEAFSRQELPEAYAKYRQVFNLETGYEALPGELREMLREPLNMWLVARTYAGQAIPDKLKVTELAQQYVSALQRSERLGEEDLRLLERRLVPLMVREGHYSNALTIADIDAAGDTLYEAIYSEQMLSDGQQVNQSFINLVDAEILVRQEEGREQKIVFKYERFYEYFVGKRIFELSEAETDRSAFFLDMVGRTTEVPFLWGGVKNALVQDLREQGPATVLQLCYTDQQRVKEMMVSVLIDFGYDNRIAVEGILNSLVPPGEKATRLQDVRRLLGASAVTADIRSRNAKKIAIEVASNLSILWVLQTAALQADPTIRTVAVRYTYYLWQGDPDSGFEILETLAQSAMHSLIPNFAAFESFLGLSLTMFFEHPTDEAVLKRLQDIWREIIRKIPGFQEVDSRRGNRFRELVRKQIFSIAISIIFRLLQEFPGYGYVYYPDLEAFFQLRAEEKTLYRRLVQYIDVEGDYSREQMEIDFLAVLTIRDFLIEIVTHMGLTAHTVQSPISFIPYLRKFLEEAQKDPLPNPYPSYLPLIVGSVMDRDPMADQEIFEFFVDTVEVCQEYYARNTPIPGIKGTRSWYKSPEASYLGAYSVHQYQRTGTVRTDLLEMRIDAALSDNNIAFFDYLLKAELAYVGIQSRRPRIALDVISLFFDRRNAEIDQMTQSFLARLRTHYPDDVDSFLDEQGAPEEFRLQVRTNESDETVGELIGARIWFFFRDDVIIGSPILRAQLMRIFAKAADCKNMREWMDYVIRELINLIYGGEGLRQGV